MGWAGDGYGYDLTEEERALCETYSKEQPVRAYGISVTRARRDLLQGKAAEIGVVRILEGLGWTTVHGVDFAIYPRTKVGHGADLVMNDPDNVPWKLSVKSSARDLWSWVYQWDGWRGDVKLRRDNPDGWLEVFTIISPITHSSRLVGLIDLQHLKQRKLFYRLQGANRCLRNKRAIYYESERIAGEDADFDVKGLLTVPAPCWKVISPSTAKLLPDT